MCAEEKLKQAADARRVASEVLDAARSAADRAEEHPDFDAICTTETPIADNEFQLFPAGSFRTQDGRPKEASGCS